MKIDVTELSCTDDLHDPQGAILEAQQMAAKTFGAEHTFFLVGGSTSGNLALLLSVCEREDIIIVQRNVHKSIINGLKLAGAQAVFISPQIDKQTGLATIPSVENISQALEEYPSAKAVFLTNPNYYGIGYKLDKWVDVVHGYNIPLLVDEAHGAHYSLHPKLPTSALAAGADAVIQSTHKTLPALTMSAMLHTQGNRLNIDRIQQTLSMIESSSPSFLLLMSLDISRAMIDQAGAQLFDQSIRTANELRSWIKNNDGAVQAVYSDCNDGAVQHSTVYSNITGLCHSHYKQLDPLRVLLYDRTGTFSGFELQTILEENNCWIEMSDSIYSVLVISIGMSEASIEPLKKTLYIIEERIANQLQNAAACNSNTPNNEVNNPILIEDHPNHGTNWSNTSNTSNTISKPIAFSRTPNAKHAVKVIKLEEAEGYEAAEQIIPYPPGIPLLYEGERWTKSAIAEVGNLARAGARFQNARDITMNTILVFDKQHDQSIS